MRNSSFLIWVWLPRIRNDQFLIWGGLPLIRDGLFLIRVWFSQIRNRLFLMRSNPSPMRNSPMLIWVWLPLISNGPFLIGSRLSPISNRLFLMRVCLPLMKEKQLLSGGWILLFSESLSSGALREGYVEAACNRLTVVSKYCRPVPPHCSGETFAMRNIAVSSIWMSYPAATGVVLLLGYFVLAIAVGGGSFESSEFQIEKLRMMQFPMLSSTAQAAASASALSSSVSRRRRFHSRRGNPWHGPCRIL